jgi:3-phenylpropionate/cinnamic acid dioxygenase small subunit
MSADVEAAIRAVLLRYARGVDRGDLDLVLSAFHEDATADHGAGFTGNAHAAWTKRLGHDPDPMDRVGIGDADIRDDRLVTGQHHITNHIVNVEPEGDRARSEAYFLAYYLTDRGGRRYLASVGGRYVDRFERRDGEWRISQRISVHDWDRVEEVVHSFPNSHRWVQGRRDRSDASYGETR